MIQIDMENTKEYKNNNENNKKHKFLSKRPKQKHSLGYKIVAFFLILFTTFAVGVFALDRFGNSVFSTCDDGSCSIINPSKQVNKGFLSGLIEDDPELQQENGMTGFLIVGLDSRRATKEGDTYKADMMNTDTLIQVIYDHEKGTITMISIPRDLYIENKEISYRGKVNGLYFASEKKLGAGKGIEPLKRQIETMTGVKIQYYGIVTFDIVKDLINTFGDEVNGKKGLYIDVPEAFNEKFPDESGKTTGYINISFKAGNQFIDTERLMMYARARQLTSDWKRAERQQQVIDALKQKVLSTDSLLKPSTILDSYNTFKKNIVMSPIGTEDVKALIGLKDKIAGSYTSVVIDPKFGGINKLIVTYPRDQFGGASLQGPVGYDYTFSKVSGYVEKILDYPLVYKEEPKIIIYNYTGDKKLATTNLTIKDMLDSMPLEMEIKNNAVLEFAEIEIYDFTEGKKPETLKILEEKFGVKAKPLINPETGVANFKATSKEDFAIRIGKTPVAPIEEETETTNSPSVQGTSTVKGASTVNTSVNVVR